jgi:cytochrome c553
MKTLVILVSVFFFSLAFAAALAQQQMPEINPKAELLRSIEHGKLLFNDPKLGTTGKSCNDCHVEGGTKDGQMGKMTIKAFDNLAPKYPKYFMMSNRVVTLDQMVNWCIITPMKGTVLAWDDQGLADLVAYTASIKVPAKAPEKGK